MVDREETASNRERYGAFAHLIPLGERRRLGLIIRRMREQSGLQQGEVATKLGVTQAVLSKIESGHREVTVLELRAICAALDAEPASIFDQLDTI